MSEPPPAKLHTERGPPAYFAGREAELAMLGERLELVLEEGDATDGMALILGVPGMGKTRLGRKFIDSVAGDARGADIACMMRGAAALHNDVGLFLAIGDALRLSGEFRAVAEMDTRTTARGGGAGPVRANVTREHIRHTGDFQELLRQTASQGLWKGKALVLVFDELQALKVEGAQTLATLHQGLHGCPILTVGLGLQNLPAVLAQHGISRVAKPIHLQPLAPREAIVAIEQGLLALGHEVPKESARRLAEASFGFPQHIHEYLESARDVILEHGHVEPGPSLDRALALGDEGRVAYYTARLENVPHQISAMLPVIDKMRAANLETLTERTAIAEIDNAGFNGNEVVDAAIAHGVLTRKDGAVGFGIPSFHNHMVERSQAYRAQLRAEHSASNKNYHRVPRSANRGIPAASRARLRFASKPRAFLRGRATLGRRRL